MAEHVWSVLCYKGCLDKYTNQVSLLDVVEAITLTPFEPLPEKPQGKGFRCQLHLVSLWMRSKIDVPEMARCRFRLETPDGSQVEATELEMDLKQGTRSRTFFRMETLPYHGPGLYSFVVEQHDEVTKKWKRAARIPLEIRLDQPQPETATAKQTSTKSSPGPKRESRAGVKRPA